jgi:hypothetical protein
MQSSPAKERKCKVKGCYGRFIPRSSMHCACSPVCALTIARAKREKDEQRKRSDERKKDREKRDKLKTRSDYMKDAQREFNRYIRLRDCGLPCICCGLDLGHGELGGAFDCGHYRSVGSAPHLRFHEDNAHAQRKQCNRYGGGRAVDYRIGLVRRIGLERVEALEADQSPKHYTIEDLKHIIATYRAKAKELLKERDNGAG